jgi:hypothetical protein
MGRGLDKIVSPSTKNLSFAACEPFFAGYAKLSQHQLEGLFSYGLSPMGILLLDLDAEPLLLV